MLIKAVRIFQILSLDIVSGAMILLRFFCSYYGEVVGIEMYLVLGTTVWLIYTIDHLHDAKKAPMSKRARYQFHFRYRKALRLAVFTAFGLNLFLVFLLDPRIIAMGSILALLSGIYLITQKWLAGVGLKEMYIAFIYTLGILLVPFVLSGSFSFGVFILLFLLTYSNLILISWFERKKDIDDRFISIATIMEGKKLEKLIIACLALGVSLSLVQDLHALNSYFVVAFSVYSILLLRAKTLKKKEELYRIIGDGVFMIPILFF